MEIIFPKNFLWGTATSAYQIEGAFDQDGKGFSNWDIFTKKKNKIKNFDNGDIACDHYNKWEEDIELISKLNIKSYRFSISWSRILPLGKGLINSKGLDFYEKLVDKLLKLDIIPFITLYHWDLPFELEKDGGWYSRQTSHLFADYTEIVLNRLGNKVKNWITINEPWIVMMAGHVLGAHAPGNFRPYSSLKVAHNLLLAHGLAVQRIRKISPESKVGITNALTPVYSNTLDKESKSVSRANALMNKLWLDPIYHSKYPDEILDSVISQNRKNLFPEDLKIISEKTDFLGVNHYSRMVVKNFLLPLYSFFPVIPKYEGIKLTSMGWEIYPNGFYDLLIWIKNSYQNPPIYITENGVSLKESLVNGKLDDPERIDYLKEYLFNLKKAIAKGVDVRGYFLWSFMDNFEWQEGFEKTFGIVHIDRTSPDLKRTPKESAYWYSKLIKYNSFQYN
ncbi:MAG: GH1 family beta-glucosidase [Leptospiraceae bacterium]|nr:GH1 family beta-glucosidase [Leptospiraceae bacterium]